jgi:hypothetical protein
MDKLDQGKIIQEIFDRAISAAESEWSELMITYQVEGGRSGFGNSYLITKNGSTREKPLPVSNDFDIWLRRLRTELAKNGSQPFTSCRLHFYANGKFEATYGYGSVDWDGLATAGWNFSSTTDLH